jgi:predicted Zn finger-like uncharacterized protein
MNVSCGNCPAKYAVPDDKVRGRKVRIQCKRCGAAIVVDGSVLTTGTSTVPTRSVSNAPAGAAGAADAKVAASRAAAKRTMIGLPPPAVLPSFDSVPPPAPPPPLEAIAAPQPPEPPPPASEPVPPPRARTATMVGVPPPAFLDAKGGASFRDRLSTRNPSQRPPSPAEWTVAVTEHDQREMSTPDIVALYIGGTVHDDTFIWKEGMSDWQTPWDIPAIAAVLRAKGITPPVAEPAPVPGPAFVLGQASRAVVDEEHTIIAKPSAAQLRRASHEVDDEEHTIIAKPTAAQLGASSRRLSDEDSTIVARVPQHLMEFTEDEDEVTVIARAGDHLPAAAAFSAAARRESARSAESQKPANDEARYSYDDVTISLGQESSRELLRAAADAERDDEVTVAFGNTSAAQKPPHPLVAMTARPAAGRPPSSAPAPAAAASAAAARRVTPPPTPDGAPMRPIERRLTPAAAAPPTPRSEDSQVTGAGDDNKPLGARNESSVLFTLNALTAQRKPEPATPNATDRLLLDRAPPPPIAPLGPTAFAAAVDAAPAKDVPSLAAPDFSAPPPELPSAHRRRWPWLILLMLVLAGGAAAAYHFKQPRILFERYLPRWLPAHADPQPAAAEPPLVRRDPPLGASDTRSDPRAAEPAPTTASPAAAIDAGAAATGVSPAAGSAAAVGDAAAPATGTAEFDKVAASDALRDAAFRAAKCKKPGQRGGSGRVTVTFETSGKASGVELVGTLTETAFAPCVKEAYGAVNVSPFGGAPVSMSRSVRIE